MLDPSPYCLHASCSRVLSCASKLSPTPSAVPTKSATPSNPLPLARPTLSPSCPLPAPSSLPAGGDELQGVKKGIVEVADAILVNKCDGAMETPARHAAAEYRRALGLVRPKHTSLQLPGEYRQHLAAVACAPHLALPPEPDAAALRCTSGSAGLAISGSGASSVAVGATSDANEAAASVAAAAAQFRLQRSLVVEALAEQPLTGPAAEATKPLLAARAAAAAAADAAAAGTDGVSASTAAGGENGLRRVRRRTATPVPASSLPAGGSSQPAAATGSATAATGSDSADGVSSGGSSVASAADASTTSHAAPAAAEGRGHGHGSSDAPPGHHGPSFNVALWSPPVLRVSAHQPAAGDGIPALWAACEAFWRSLGGIGVLASRRQAQASSWMWGEFESQLVAAGRRSAAVRAAAGQAQADLVSGHITPRRAGRGLFAAFMGEAAGAGQPAPASPAALPAAQAVDASATAAHSVSDNAGSQHR